MKNKKKIIIISSIAMFILLLGVLLISNTSSNNEDILEEVNISKNKTFAIMLQNDSGGYVESDSNTFPSNGYELNTTLTNCVDETGTKVEDVISYENGNIAVETNKKVYCYLYFDVNAYEQLVNYTMLYDSGDECTDITGGWKQGSHANGNANSKWGGITFNEDYMDYFWTNAQGGSGGVATINKIDLSDYTFAFAKAAHIQGSASSGKVLYVSYSAQDYGVEYGPIYGAAEADVSTVPTSNTPYIMNIDIPAETGFKYICVGSGAYNALQLYVYNVWLTKWDDWLSLASIANIKASSISDVLANSDIIFKNKEAVEFMIHNCTGDFMVSAIQNDTFITALENSEYADIVYENEHWAKFLAMVE